jgi:hypothetical protein
MADFDDATDPAFGAACNRLAAFTLPIPDGALVDEASGLTEADLIMILRHLHATRRMVEVLSIEEATRRHGPGVPAEQAVPVTTWSDKELIAQYQRTGGEPGNEYGDRLLAEIQRRDLDL